MSVKKGYYWHKRERVVWKYAGTKNNGMLSSSEVGSHWDLFAVPEAERPNPYDGHTPAIALARMMAFLGRADAKEVE